MNPIAQADPGDITAAASGPALVTGASAGIGLAIAARLAADGHPVAICARRRAGIDQALRSLPGNAVGIVADVSLAGDAIRCVDEAVEQLGSLSILVNNAGGVDRFAGFAELDDEDWQRSWELNLMSAVRVTRAALPHLLAAEDPAVVNVSSESAVQPDGAMPHYNAAKGALNTFGKSLSQEYGRQGLRVNTVSPAFTWTPLVENVLGRRGDELGVPLETVVQEYLREARPNIVAERPGRPEEVAAAVAFLCSPEATFVQGAILRVDGGSVAHV